jgi:DNA-binding NarL/FixJ family response regulator
MSVSSPTSPVRIALVEDQPALLKQLQRALSRFGELEIVVTAQDGESAVELLPEARPDVVLLDLELPDFNGIEVTRRLLRRIPETAILILTSFDDEQKVYEAIQAGASGYLVKRVGPEKIRDSIHEVLAGGTVLEPLIARRFWNHFQSMRPGAVQDGGPGLSATPVPAEDPWGLSPTELEILRFLAKGLTNAEVGEVLTLEVRAVRRHLAKLYRKMGVDSHVAAVVAGLRAGLIEL